VTRSLTVTNDSGAPAHVELYASGAAVGDGGFTLVDDTDAPIARWATVEPASLDLAPAASAMARLRIAIPDDARDGERYGVVWAQVGAGDDDAQAVVNRVGVRIFVLVGGGTSDLQIESMTPRRDAGGNAIVELALANTGDRAVDVTGALQLDDDVHDSEPTAAVAFVPTVAPGATTSAVVAFDEDVANGPWEAMATLEANGRTLRAHAQLTFPAADGGRGDAVPASMIGGDGVPVIALVIAAGAIAGATALAWRARRRLVRS
jgi:hypothetical protein